LLQYDRMVEQALRGVVREAIARVSQFGLPAGHSLYVTFKSAHPGVDLAESLRLQYPEAMTIVLEHQYWDLTVEGEAFAVTLSFKGRRHRLTVPFAAIAAFHDPGVPFSLRIEQAGESEAAAEPAAGEGASPPVVAGATPLHPAKAVADDEDKKAPSRGGEVVSLESFRKK
jgi:hypothetical protein